MLKIENINNIIFYNHGWINYRNVSLSYAMQDV